MLSNLNAMDVIQSEMKKAAEAAKAAEEAKKAAGKGPVFLWLKPGHKALIRPLCGLENAYALARHNKWHADRDQRINAICASEVGKPCLYCSMARNKKAPQARGIIYLPVYVYQITGADGKVLTYEEKQADSDIKVTKEVRDTVRLLELSAYGTAYDILTYFLKFPLDPDNHPIDQGDFSIEQDGEGQAKKFIIMHKTPKPAQQKVKDAIAALNKQEMIDRIIFQCPPVSEGEEDPFANGIELQKEAEIVEDDSIAPF